MPYFNHRVHMTPAAEATALQRYEFLSTWWSIYAPDRRWTPPCYSDLSRELQPRHNPHIARQRPLLVHVDALLRTGLQTPRQGQSLPLSAIIERSVAAAVVLHDPRRNDKTGYLALLQTVNDYETIERLLAALSDTIRHSGLRRVLVSTGLSPYWGSGIQTDAWDSDSPFGAPSNPPYLPGLLNDLLRPIETAQSYALPVVPISDGAYDPSTLCPLDPQRLARDLLPLLAAALDRSANGFAPPDSDEAAFLLRWLHAGSMSGWVAERHGRPVGFVLLGQDRSGMLRRHQGGKQVHRRAGLAVNERFSSSRKGQAFFGCVIAEERGQGIGRQLWNAAMATAVAQSWQSLTIGPVWAQSGQAFLATRGAIPIQAAELMELTL